MTLNPMTAWVYNLTVNPVFATWVGYKVTSDWETFSRRQTPSIQLAGMRQTSNKMLSSAATPTKQ